MTKELLALPLLAAQTELGECPVWDPSRNAFFFMDIIKKQLHRIDWRTKELTSLDTPGLGGGLVLASDGSLIACLDTGVHKLDPDTGKFEFVVQPEHEKDHRLNEAKADPAGRLWVGSISTLGRFPDSSLYRVALDGSVETLLTGISVPNTMAWLPDGKTMLFADSPTKEIWQYDFDAVTASISNRRVFVDCSDYVGMPDGAAVDSEGGVWVAEFGGGKVRRYDRSGNVTHVVQLPATQVTSCAFVGEHLDELVIITTKRLLDGEQRRRQSQAGDLFIVRPDVPGLPPHLAAPL